jgi:hypothetical protein
LIRFRAANRSVLLVDKFPEVIAKKTTLVFITSGLRVFEQSVGEEQEAYGGQAVPIMMFPEVEIREARDDLQAFVLGDFYFVLESFR